MQLSQLKVIVTGHSRGLGAALAENLLGRGHAVLGIARSANDALGARFPAARFQASGGLSSLADIRALGEADCSGVVMGRALLEGRFTLGATAAMRRPISSGR